LKKIIYNFIVNVIASSKFISLRVRYRIYRLYGIDVLTNNIFYGTFFLTNKVSIGTGTFMNSRCKFENNEMVKIGKNCAIGSDVLICTDTHEIASDKRRAGKTIFSSIKIEDGCWIGARATILSGVTIGHGCIIAAGSLVNKNCEPNGIYAGVPAKRIRDL
jgi:maltose O-acetyltransferase